MIKIVVDTLGGDRSPGCNIEGAVNALNKFEDLYIIFTGNKDIIEKELEKYSYSKERIEIIHAPDEISCNDVPTIAIRSKKESSLYAAFDLLRNNEDINALVSNGSTGAIIAGSVLRIGRIDGVIRPALCPIMPTVSGGIVAVCDSGANSECEPAWLNQFALMSSLYMKKAYNISSPRIALLNIGTEEEKGDTLRKETYQLLKANNDINFVGNMESRDLLGGDYDVVVCDGFSGNVLLKSTEGACLELLGMLKKTFYKNIKTKIGALILKKDIYQLKNFMDYNNYGGAVMLGVKKTIVKGHGSCKSSMIFHCIEQAYNIEKNNLRQAIEDGIKLSSYE